MLARWLTITQKVITAIINIVWSGAITKVCQQRGVKTGQQGHFAEFSKARPQHNGPSQEADPKAKWRFSTLLPTSRIQTADPERRWPPFRYPGPKLGPWTPFRSFWSCTMCLAREKLPMWGSPLISAWGTGEHPVKSPWRSWCPDPLIVGGSLQNCSVLLTLYYNSVILFLYKLKHSGSMPKNGLAR